MLENIEKIKIIRVIKGVTPQRVVHTNYLHRIIFRMSGSVSYDVGDEKLVLDSGDVLFLPHGQKYKYVKQECCEYIMVDFEGDLPDTEHRPCVLRGHVELRHIFLQLYRSWSIQTPANSCRCMSILYELLAQFAEADINQLFPTTIEPALEYLERHIFDPKLRISTLYTLCGVSDTYFRRMFQARFGIAPKRYIMERRLTQAKAILDSGEFESINEVAQLTGFDDPLYFSKVFRNKYGYPPSLF